MAGADREFQQKHPERLFAKMLRSVHYPPPPAGLKPYDSKGQPNNDFFRWIKAHYWDQNDFTDKRLLYNDLWYRYLNGYLEKFTAAQPDSLNAAIDRLLRKMPKDSLFYQFTVQYTSQLFEQSGWPGADRVFVHLADTYLQPGSTPWLDEATLLRIQYKADINRPNLTGNPAPPLVLPDETDHPVRLDTIHAPFTLLIFYSPLCEHCMSYLPDIYQTYLDARPLGLAAVAVNTDNEYQNWKQFVVQQGWLWYDVADPSGKNDFEKPFAAFNLPVLYLLDKDKKILLKRIPPEDLRQVLQYYLQRK
jgi:thiol-disulfide isomerase/thioredoxin